MRAPLGTPVIVMIVVPDAEHPGRFGAPVNVYGIIVGTWHTNGSSRRVMRLGIEPSESGDDDGYVIMTSSDNPDAPKLTTVFFGSGLVTIIKDKTSILSRKAGLDSFLNSAIT